MYLSYSILFGRGYPEFYSEALRCNVRNQNQRTHPCHEWRVLRTNNYGSAKGLFSLRLATRSSQVLFYCNLPSAGAFLVSNLQRGVLSAYLQLQLQAWTLLLMLILIWHEYGQIADLWRIYFITSITFKNTTNSRRSQQIGRIIYI